MSWPCRHGGYPKKQRGRWRAVGKAAPGRSPRSRVWKDKAVRCPDEAARPEGQLGRSAEMRSSKAHSGRAGALLELQQK